MTTIQLQSGYDDEPTNHDSENYKLVTSKGMRTYLDKSCVRYIDKQVGTFPAYSTKLIYFVDQAQTFQLYVSSLGKVDGSVSGTLSTDILPNDFFVARYSLNGQTPIGLFVWNKTNENYDFSIYFFK